jgi:hypothetical protein
MLVKGQGRHTSLRWRQGASEWIEDDASDGCAGRAMVAVQVRSERLPHKMYGAVHDRTPIESVEFPW